MHKLLDGILRVLVHCGFVRDGKVVLNKGAQKSRDLQHLCQTEIRGQLMAEDQKSSASYHQCHAPDLE